MNATKQIKKLVREIETGKSKMTPEEQLAFAKILTLGDSIRAMKVMVTSRSLDKFDELARQGDLSRENALASVQQVIEETRSELSSGLFKSSIESMKANNEFYGLDLKGG